MGDVMGLKPDADPEGAERSPSENQPVWKMNPPPPAPHWKWTQSNDGAKVEHQDEGCDDVVQEPKSKPTSTSSPQFEYNAAEIPGAEPESERCTYELNGEGVYQVMPAKGVGKPLSHVPTLKEYYMDLEFLLGVCSDGPAKSFAFRRLKYLASKWTLYGLLNEYQELADMKAVPHRCATREVS